MYCVKCGSEIPDNSEFCSVCGNRVSPERKKNGGLSVDNQTKQHKWIGMSEWFFWCQLELLYSLIEEETMRK